MGFPFSSYIYKNEADVVDGLLSRLEWSGDISVQAVEKASALVRDVRDQSGRGGGQLEAFLQEFSLNTEEGLAMMCLAEALLRIPDPATANALIRDKVAATQWLQKQEGASWLSRAAVMGLAVTRVTLDSVFARLGEPIIREAMVRAMQIMGQQFVLGTSIEDAMVQGRPWEKQGYRLSYDMLGEGARDAKTAEAFLRRTHIL